MLIFILFWTTLAAPSFQQSDDPDPCTAGAEAFRDRNLQVAESLLRRCVNLNPDLLAPRLQLCGVYQMSGRDADLLATATEGLQRFPAEKRFYLAAGYIAGKQGDYSGSIALLSEAIQRWPADQALQQALLQGYLQRGLSSLDAGDNESAAADLRRVVDMEPGHVDALLNLGRALHNLEYSMEALELFDRVLEIEPQTPLIQFNRGLVLFDMGEYDRAVVALNAEIEQESAYPPSHLFRGLALAHLGEWEKAVPDLQLAAEKMPESAEAFFGLGRCYHRLKRLPEAESAFRRSIELSAEDPRVFSSLGRLLLETGRSEEGQAVLQRARDLHAERRETRPGEVRYQKDRKVPE